MKIEIKRIEFGTDGTNGDLYVDGKLNCHTIELPWNNNQRQVSCIPTGKYQLSKHHSEKLGEVVQINDVPDRDDILIHPANNARKELQGCIAPVSSLEGDGIGSLSKPVFTPLRNDIYRCLDAGEIVELVIS